MQTLYEIWSEFLSGTPCYNKARDLTYYCTPAGILLRDANKNLIILKDGSQIEDAGSPDWEVHYFAKRGAFTEYVKTHRITPDVQPTTKIAPNP